MHPFRSLMQKLSAPIDGKCGPIGIEFAAEKLHMMQMEKTGKGLSIRAGVSLPYPCPREILLKQPALAKDLVGQALKRRPFKGKRVVSCMPGNDINLLYLSFKVADGQNYNGALMKELRDRIKDELDQSVVDFMSIRNDENSAEKNALVAVARRDKVMAYLELLRNAGLDPIALDIGPASLARLVSCLPGIQTHPNVLLVNFGRDRTYLSVIWGKRLMLDREIDFGEKTLLTRAAKTLNMSEDMVAKLLYDEGLHANGHGKQPDSDEIKSVLTEVLRPEFMVLAEEVNKTLIYTASKTRGSMVEQIYLLGSMARYPHIADFMQDLLSNPVKVLNPFDAFSHKSKATDVSQLDPIAGIALATGLSLRGMENE